MIKHYSIESNLFKGFDGEYNYNQNTIVFYERQSFEAERTLAVTND